MSNRRKPAAITPMRQPLLHVLDVEYARAARAKNLPRMEEITAIVEALKRLWSDVIPEAAPQPVPVLEVVKWQPGQLERWTAPPPLPEPLPEPEPPMDTQEALGMAPVPQQSWDVNDLLARVPEGLWGDEERRQEAKGRVRDAVLRVTHEVMAMQMRYELALQAHNRNNRALELFEPEAIALGISVGDLATRIINERRAAERRMQHVYTILARVSVEIDQAEGDRIDELVEAGIREIQAMED